MTTDLVILPIYPMYMAGICLSFVVPLRTSFWTKRVSHQNVKSTTMRKVICYDRANGRVCGLMPFSNEWRACPFRQNRRRLGRKPLPLAPYIGGP